jgi:hypothetical protein
MRPPPKARPFAISSCATTTSCWRRSSSRLPLHGMEARLCRWLLQTHDCMDGDTIPLTQEFLGEMLGVRRTTVTIVRRSRNSPVSAMPLYGIPRTRFFRPQTAIQDLDMAAPVSDEAGALQQARDAYPQPTFATLSQQCDPCRSCRIRHRCGGSGAMVLNPRRCAAEGVYELAAVH